MRNLIFPVFLLLFFVSSCEQNEVNPNGKNASNQADQNLKAPAAWVCTSTLVNLLNEFDVHPPGFACQYGDATIKTFTNEIFLTTKNSGCPSCSPNCCADLQPWSNDEYNIFLAAKAIAAADAPANCCLDEIEFFLMGPCGNPIGTQELRFVATYICRSGGEG